jgi:hypothetical protein
MMPSLSSADAVTHAAKELTAALLNPAPFATIGDQQMQALHQLTTIFNTINMKPQPSPRVKPNQVLPTMSQPNPDIIPAERRPPTPQSTPDKSQPILIQPG